jgi:aminoglycoside phosphotransferase (APT) family kinase protein
MHADELETGEALVRRLLAAQFPEWAELPLEALPSGGTDNAIYRLGDELSVRLPRRRRDWASGSLDNEFEWLPKLAPLLPLSVPTPVARGAAGEGYPHEWAVYNWLDGEEAASLPLDLPLAAVDLAELLAALQRIDPTAGPLPAGRGGPLRPRDQATRAGITALADTIDRRHRRDGGVGGGTRSTGVGPPARLDPWRSRRAESARPGWADHRSRRLGLRLRRRSGL